MTSSLAGCWGGCYSSAEAISSEEFQKGNYCFSRLWTLFADGQHNGPTAHVPAGEVQRTGAFHPHLQGLLGTGSDCSRGASHPETL